MNTPDRGLERRTSPIDGTPYLTVKGTPETVNIEPDYDRLREWMLRVWADPKQAAFRGAVLADAKLLAWLNPPPLHK